MLSSPSSSATAEKLPKQTVLNHVLLFSVAKSAITKLLKGDTTAKTDKIIFNSLLKAIDRHFEEAN